MKLSLPIILFLSLNAGIKSQNIIIEELYKIDPPFNPNFHIDSFTEVHHSFTKTVMTPDFINPTFKSIPSVHKKCNCKNNLVIDCISKTNGQPVTTYDFDYDSMNNIVEVKIVNGLNATFILNYDSINRPVKVFRKHGENVLLYESAIYKDSVVGISTFSPDGEMMIQKEYPFKVGQSKHINKINYKKNGKKVVVYSIDTDNPDRAWKAIFKLDENLNWIKKVKYQIIFNRAYVRAKTIRKIHYK